MDGPEAVMGFFLGLFSSATFGLIPLFTLPLLHAGVTAETALFYRFLIATLTLGGLLAARASASARAGWTSSGKEILPADFKRFRTRGMDLCKLAGMSVMYMLARCFFLGLQLPAQRRGRHPPVSLSGHGHADHDRFFP